MKHFTFLSFGLDVTALRTIMASEMATWGRTLFAETLTLDDTCQPQRKPDSPTAWGSAVAADQVVETLMGNGDAASSLKSVHHSAGHVYTYYESQQQQNPPRQHETKKKVRLPHTNNGHIVTPAEDDSSSQVHGHSIFRTAHAYAQAQADAQSQARKHADPHAPAYAKISLPLDLIYMAEDDGRPAAQSSAASSSVPSSVDTMETFNEQVENDDERPRDLPSPTSATGDSFFQPFDVVVLAGLSRCARAPRDAARFECLRRAAPVAMFARARATVVRGCVCVWLCPRAAALNCTRLAPLPRSVRRRLFPAQGWVQRAARGRLLGMLARRPPRRAPARQRSPWRVAPRLDGRGVAEEHASLPQHCRGGRLTVRRRSPRSAARAATSLIRELAYGHLRSSAIAVGVAPQFLPRVAMTCDEISSCCCPC